MNIADVQPGMKLKADAGFTCIADGAVLTIESNEDGELFVPCSSGRHYLDGQVDSNGKLVGLESA